MEDLDGKVMDWKKAIGQQLSIERKRLDYSQRALGEKLHLSQKTVSQIENGENPTFDNLLKYCLVLGLDFAVITARARVVVRSQTNDPAQELLS